MSAHSLRKKLQTDLEKGGMPTNWIDQVLGHQLINSRDAYSLPTDEELEEAYIKAYSQIRIMPKQIKQISQTIKEPETIEATTLEQAKNALSNGYTYAGNLQQHNTIHKTTKPTQHQINFR